MINHTISLAIKGFREEGNLTDRGPAGPGILRCGDAAARLRLPVLNGGILGARLSLV
jgi:hypothetical protein